MRNISFIEEKELEEIDDSIDYKKDGVYLDDFLKLLRMKSNNIEEILQKDESIAIKLLGEKYNGKQYSDSEKTD